VQEALDQIARIYAGASVKPSSLLDRQGPGVDPVVPVGDKPLSPYAAWPVFPKAVRPATPVNPVRYIESDGPPMPEGPFGSPLGDLVQLDARLAPPTAPESSRGFTGMENLPAASRALALLPTDGAVGEPRLGPDRSADPNIVRVADGEPTAPSGGVLIAQQDNRVPEPMGRRGIAPNVELPPGTP
jgi:hypothetical protein